MHFDTFAFIASQPPASSSLHLRSFNFLATLLSTILPPRQTWNIIKSLKVREGALILRCSNLCCKHCISKSPRPFSYACVVVHTQADEFRDPAAAFFIKSTDFRETKYPLNISLVSCTRNGHLPQEPSPNRQRVSGDRRDEGSKWSFGMHVPRRMV